MDGTPDQAVMPLLHGGFQMRAGVLLLLLRLRLHVHILLRPTYVHVLRITCNMFQLYILHVQIYVV